MASSSGIVSNTNSKSSDVVNQKHVFWHRPIHNTHVKLLNTNTPNPVPVNNNLRIDPVINGVNVFCTMSQAIPIRSFDDMRKLNFLLAHI